MARRVRNEETGFGSDSFLDIIANIVGILIILIVVSGVRVSRAPVMLADDKSASKPTPVSIPAPTPEAVPEPAAPLEPSPGLIAAIGRFESEIESIKRESQVLPDATGISQRESDLKRRIAENRSVYLAEVAKLEGRGAETLASRKSIEALRDEYQAAAAFYEATSRRKNPVETLKHRVTPVSRVVKTPEVHFRIDEGKISYVPIQELLGRLKGQIERQKNWLAKYRTHQGKVGPISGFSMVYVVERQRLSAVDQLRGGAAFMRIGVSEWKVEPSRDLKDETVDEALSSGSAFIRALQEAEADATLTFWVYPNSYAEFRKLQSFAHSQGFTVAGRPLPFGIPIAGSPNGTRSAGQ